MIIEKIKNSSKTKCNCRRFKTYFFIFKVSLLCVNHFFLINHTRKHSSLNELKGKNFVFIIIQLSELWNPTKFWILVMQMSSLLVHITNFLRTSAVLFKTLTSYYYFKSWYFKVIQFPPSSKQDYIRFLVIEFGHEKPTSTRSIWYIELCNHSWNITSKKMRGP